jgi:hypothetical protein
MWKPRRASSSLSARWAPRRAEPARTGRPIDRAIETNERTAWRSVGGSPWCPSSSDIAAPIQYRVNRPDESLGLEYAGSPPWPTHPISTEPRAPPATAAMSLSSAADLAGSRARGHWRERMCV